MVSIVLTSACFTSLKVLDDTYQPHQRYHYGRQAKQKREHNYLLRQLLVPINCVIVLLKPFGGLVNLDPGSSDTRLFAEWVNRPPAVLIPGFREALKYDIAYPIL